MQPIDSIETYPYGTSKDLVGEKEEMKCNNEIQIGHKFLTIQIRTNKLIIHIDQSTTRYW